METETWIYNSPTCEFSPQPLPTDNSNICITETHLTTAVFQDKVDVIDVLKITVKLNDVCMMKWTMKLYLTHYLHTVNIHSHLHYRYIFTCITATSSPITATYLPALQLWTLTALFYFYLYPVGHFVSANELCELRSVHNFDSVDVKQWVTYQ